MAGTEGLEAFECAGELTFEAGVIAIEKIERTALGEGGYGEGCTCGFLFTGEAFGLFAHFEGNGGAFGSPETDLAPSGGDEGVDKGGFDEIAGMKLVVEEVGEIFEACGRFFVEDHVAGEETVTEAVAGGGGFTGLGDGTFGFAAVDARGVGLAFGHGLPIVI